MKSMFDNLNDIRNERLNSDCIMRNDAIKNLKQEIKDICNKYYYKPNTWQIRCDFEDEIEIAVKKLRNHFPDYIYQEFTDLDFTVIAKDEKLELIPRNLITQLFFNDI